MKGAIIAILLCLPCAKSLAQPGSSIQNAGSAPAGFANGLVIYKPEAAQNLPQFYHGALFISATAGHTLREYNLGRGAPLRLPVALIVQEIPFHSVFETDFTNDQYLNFNKDLQQYLANVAKKCPKVAKIVTATNASIQEQIARYEKSEVRFRGEWMQRSAYFEVLRAEENARSAEIKALKEQQRANEVMASRRAEEEAEDARLSAEMTAIEEKKRNIEAAEQENAKRTGGPNPPKYRVKAETGEKDNQFQLGLAYLNGDGVPQSDEYAYIWFLKAAEQGYAIAEYSVGECLARGAGTERDPKAAAAWFERAANKGIAPAQLSLGNCYRDGFGVVKDFEAAVNWYRAAADAGIPAAQLSLADSYSLGMGVSKDSAEAVKLYRLAAKAGLAEAQSTLGYLYSIGEGVAKDPVEACKWFLLAAEQGNPNAQFNLASAYVDGEGVNLDYEEAYFWYSLAAAQKVDGASNNLTVLDGQLSEDQVQKAKQRAAQWQKSKSVQENGRKIIVQPSGESAPAVEANTHLHLPSDVRLISGSVLADLLQQAGGKGKLILDNGLVEDAYVKLICDGKLAASFYVRGGERFTFDHIPDETYRVLYCTGFGWDSTRRDFARGRKARRYDDPLIYATTRRTEGTRIITSTAVITLTLHKVPSGNINASDITLEEFDRY